MAQSGFLVKDKTGEHLPTKTDGKPDHRLMGAAWAALHEGYRGNKYEGPNKQEAIRKLMAMYKAEGMIPPGEAKKEKSYTIAANLIAQVKRAGARHSAIDRNLVQQLHDIAMDLGAECYHDKGKMMTVEDIRQYAPNPMLKAAVEALILRHPGHGNQKVHGNRFGGGQAKESLRRLKGDKEAREAYKTTARKKQGRESNPVGRIRTGSFVKGKGTSYTGIVTGYGNVQAGKKNIPAYKIRDARGRTSAIPIRETKLITNSEAED